MGADPHLISFHFVLMLNLSPENRRNSVSAAMFALQDEKPVFHEGSAASAKLMLMYENINSDWHVVVASAPDDPALPGDCPHCHRVLMILLAKKINFKLSVVAPHTQCEIDWLTSSSTQQPPILRYQRTIITNVDDISEFIETQHPEPSLLPPDYDLIDLGTELFSAFFLYLKNKRPAVDETLREKVNHFLIDFVIYYFVFYVFYFFVAKVSFCVIDQVVTQLREINDLLVQSGGPYIAGESLTLADCNLWPKLHHTLIALGQFKQFFIPDEFLAILAYIGTMMETNVVELTRYPDSWVHQRWKKYMSPGSLLM
eukprot:c1149_g1_i2.p1 GENE.c1149_g1_i2~~c1149_g1_i2.p1  ORF type:complete len:314 (-),score=67.68 c1149_g1_i2:18-959(-)